MCTNNWPLLLDLTRDECKRILRRLELEAYSAVLTAFRAQGDLSKDKKSLLHELQNVLSISTERHRAEVRRAVNDEKLTTIADNMAGPDISSEWQVEGRRLIPLMPRLVPQTAFTVTANNAASIQAEKNLALPPPALTGSREGGASAPSTPVSAGASSAPKSTRPASPASNVVVLPSGMSIHIKGGLNTEEDEVPSKKRRRSSSSEVASAAKTTQIVSTPTVQAKTSMSMAGGAGVQGVSPMKITFTKSPAKTQTTVTPSQKVILVSTTSHSGSTPTIIQKPMSVPVIKTTTTTGGTVTTFTSPRASIIMPASIASSVANGNLGNIVTVATTSTMGTPLSSAVTALTTANPTILASSLQAARPRTKMFTTRPKTPQVGGPRGGIVMQMGGAHGSPIVPGSQNLHNIQVKPVHSKPTIHIKHEGGMKIITQGMPTSASKILPKPPGGAGGSPMVVGSSSQPSITMVSKSGQSLAGQMGGGRVLNITTQGGKVIASTSNRGTTANVVTVNPKTLQLTAIKGAGGTTVLTTSGRVATATGAKPNVIVVQKAQPKRTQTPTSHSQTITLPKTPPTGATNSPFEKKQDSTVKHIVTTQKPIVKQVIAKSMADVQQKRAPHPIVSKVRADGQDIGRSSLLADLIQAVGIQPDGTSDVHTTSSTSRQEQTPRVQTVVVQQEEVAMTTPQSSVVTIPSGRTEIVTSSKDVGGNQWVEYDVPQTTTGRDASDTSAIKALLDLQSSAKLQTTRTKVSDINLSRITTQSVPHTDTYTIETTVPRQKAVGQPVTSTRENVQYIQTSQSQDVTESTTSVVLEQPGGETVAVQLTGDLSQLSSLGQEIMGELDPETGIFYSTAPGGGETATAVVMTNVPTTVVPTTKMVTATTGPATVVAATTAPVSHTGGNTKPLDFLSSALNQAQIDLDPYQFIEEDEPSPYATKLPQVASTETTSHAPNQGALLSMVTTQPSIMTSEPVGVAATTSTLNTTVVSQTPGFDDDDLFFVLGLQRPVEQHTSVLQAIEAESLVSQVPFSQAQDVTPVVLESTPGPSEGTLPRPESSSLIPGLTTQPASMAPQISGGTSKTTVVVPQVTGVTSHMAGQTSKTSVVVSQVPSVTSHVPGLVSKASIMTSQKTGAVSQASSGTKSGLSSQTGLTTQVSGVTPQKSAMPYTSSVTLQSSIVTSQITGVTSQSTGAISETTDVRSQASHLTSQPVGLPSELVLQSVHSTSAIPEQVDLQEVPSSTTDGPPASAEVRGTTPSTVASSAVTSSMTPGMVREELLEEMVVSDGIMNLEQHEVCVPDTASNVTVAIEPASNVSVAVEPAGLDTTTMILEDFTSMQQQIMGEHGDLNQTSGLPVTATSTLPPAAAITAQTSEQIPGHHPQGSGDGGLPYGEGFSSTQGEPYPGSCSSQESPSTSEGNSESSLASPVRASQRKRRPPSMPDDSPPHGHGQGNMQAWVRLAAGVLQKVCKYRGAHKEKGELNASAWFLAPVDPKEVPDYYDIIKEPMDFGTVRHKLETCQYDSWDDCHMDMLLVQQNCHRYNPPGHEIRRDCEEVFGFYLGEYERSRDKWQKMHQGSSPANKKPRLEPRSPVRL